jgi:hypothetical protein
MGGRFFELLFFSASWLPRIPLQIHNPLFSPWPNAGDGARGPGCGKGPTAAFQKNE